MLKYFIAYLLLFGAIIPLHSQPSGSANSDLIPMDKNLVQGHFSNGLKYYILKNEKPEKRAELRLVVNAGSVLEDENQRGLAHFVEHMAFNGSKNFKKQELIDYLEGVGTKFGAHLNAYTSFDETVYMLQIPTDDKGIYQKTFQILEDWAHQISFDPEEIEKERGVVIEEWRLGLGAQDRMFEKIFPIQYKDSRYPERLPIGKKEVLDNFTHETLIKFYKDWYRPDLMSVIVIGDVDVAETEALIKKHFESLKNPTNPRPRKMYEVPIQKGVRVAVASDKEAFYSNLSLNYMSEVLPVQTKAQQRDAFVKSLCTQMISARFKEYSQQGDAPFSFAFSGYGNSLRTSASLYNAAYLNLEQIPQGLRVLIQESKRLEDQGFIDTEIARAKEANLKRLEEQVKEKDKTKSENLIWSYVDMVLSNNRVADVSWNYAYAKEQFETINKEELNKQISQLITANDVVITVTGPEKEGQVFPTEEEIKKWYAEIQKEEVASYEDVNVDRPLVTYLPDKGQVIKRNSLSELGAVELTLSNGAKVIYKSTDFTENQIEFGAFGYGGYSKLVEGETDIASVRLAASAISAGGVGDFSPIELEKKLSGKQVSVRPYINNYESGIWGRCAASDFETALQLLHLNFYAPRPDQEALKAWVSRSKTFVQNSENQPITLMYDKLNEIATSGHPWFKSMKSADYDKVSLYKGMQVYMDRFDNAANFTFVFVGNIPLDSFEVYAERYIGSLPGKFNTSESYKDMKVKPLPGVQTAKVYKGSEPQSQVSLTYWGEYDKSEYNAVAAKAAEKALSIQLRKALREEKGGTYGVNVSYYFSKIPNHTYSLTISFGCAPENVDELLKETQKVLKTLLKKGPLEEDLAKYKETERRDREVQMQENRFWFWRIKSAVQFPDDFASNEAYLAKIESLTKDEVKTFFKKNFNKKQMYQVVLYPEQEK